MPNNFNTPSDIERVVMRRVHTIRALQLLASPVALALIVCAAALWGIGQEVWVARVFQNAPAANDPFAFLHFYFAAFEHTQLPVQIFSLATLFSLVYLAREAAKPLTNVLVAPLRVRA